MNTQKVAITMPSDLVVMIDNMSRHQKLSRSKFISLALRQLQNNSCVKNTRSVMKNSNFPSRWGSQPSL